MNQVLVVDDEAAMRAALEANFRQQGWKVTTAGGTREALERFRLAPCPLVVTDMRMPDGDGLRVMQGVRALAPETAVIFLTAFANVPEAVHAMREGACDYLVKPISFEQLEEAAARVLGARGNRGPAPGNGEFIGHSMVTQRLIERARQVARTDADILLEAESGTGKELLARLVHRSSPRSQRPFVPVNCAGFPDTLLESELFGHVRGAFTGAMTSKAGKFELAHTGTLLLDEIAEMPLSLQPKLLRVLQEREIDRLGDTRPLPIDVRVIATTNRPWGLGGGREVSPRPVLPAQRHSPRASASTGTPRGYSGSDRPLHWQVRVGLSLQGRAVFAGTPGAAPSLRLARKRARTREFCAPRAGSCSRPRGGSGNSLRSWLSG